MKTNNELISELTKLSLEKSCIIRGINLTYNRDERHKMFVKLKDLEKEMKRIKFELRLVREMKK